MTKKRVQKATKDQVKRIDELGEQIYGPELWLAERKKIFGDSMTPNRARYVIIRFQSILGTKV